MRIIILTLNHKQNYKQMHQPIQDPHYTSSTALSNIYVTSQELELILRSLPLGTAVGPE